MFSPGSDFTHKEAIQIEDMERAFRSLLPDDSDQELAGKMAEFLETHPPIGGWEEDELPAVQDYIVRLKEFAGEHIRVPPQKN